MLYYVRLYSIKFYCMVKNYVKNTTSVCNYYDRGDWGIGTQLKSTIVVTVTNEINIVKYML